MKVYLMRQGKSMKYTCGSMSYTKYIDAAGHKQMAWDGGYPFAAIESVGTNDRKWLHSQCWIAWAFKN